MSRVGKMPISVPSGTKIEIKDGLFTAQGPKGSVSEKLFDGFPVELEDGVITVKRPGDDGQSRAKHGLLRALLANAVEGATNGFTKRLELIGVGYRAEVKGQEIHMALGYSHPVVYTCPKDVKAEVDKQNKITLTGPNRQQVGQVAAEIRKLRRPDPYKGKGFRYEGEQIRRKVGKAGGK